MSLPLLLNQYESDEKAVADLIDAYRDYLNEIPGASQVSVWKTLTKGVINIISGYPSFAEFPIFNLERADYVIVDTDAAQVIEAKGWKNIERIDERVVVADGELRLDPCYQLNNYVSKFNYFHSSGREIKYSGSLLLYNNRTYSSEDCEIVHTFGELRDRIAAFRRPEGQSIVDKIRNGEFHVSDDFIELINQNKSEIISNASSTLLGRGYGLTENQALLIHDVLDAVKGNEDRTFLVKGSSGSGKTLVAVYMLLESFLKGYNVFLAYRNNRLLNTLKQILETKDRKYSLSPQILYYSTGKGTGIGEANFPARNYGKIDLIIYDEAQRMTESVIRTTQGRSTVKVYFYDDKQILIGDEAGTFENFEKSCRNITKREFLSVFRSPVPYLQFVRHLLYGAKATGFSEYRLRVFDMIKDMLGDLRKIHDQGMKIALMCAFTESKGDMRELTGIDNRRIGYPLASNLDIYRGTDLDIYWLMDPKTEYPRYWSGKIDPLSRCASVYGSQGFEAQYTGLVWGRDLIWRNGWVVNGEPITDGIGNHYSLKRLSKTDPVKALELLRNRYYILLTRGIKGTDIFFEDPETGKKVKSDLESINVQYE